MTDHLILLAGGASSRMKKSSGAHISETQTTQANTKSKALILLHNKPMIEFLLYNAMCAGLQNIYIVVGKDSDDFIAHFKNSNSTIFSSLYIQFVHQEIPESRVKPLGTADAIFQALNQFPALKQNQFLVCNCDNLYSVAAFTALRDVKSPHAFINYDRDALRFSIEKIEGFALTKTNNENYLVDIIEKPTAEQVPLFEDNEGKLRVSMNIFKFDGEQFFPFLASCKLHPQRNEKELPAALLNMVKAFPTATFAIPFSEHVPDLTGKEDILEMNKYLATHPLTKTENL